MSVSFFVKPQRKIAAVEATTALDKSENPCYVRKGGKNYFFLS